MRLVPVDVRSRRRTPAPQCATSAASSRNSVGVSSASRPARRAQRSRVEGNPRAGSVRSRGRRRAAQQPSHADEQLASTNGFVR
jgi:hypothetical protein